MHHVSDNGKLFSGLDKAKKHRPKSYQGIIRCRPKNSDAVALRSGAHGGLMCPLEKGVRGIETSGSGYLRQQIRGGRKGRAERQGLGQQHNPAKKSARSATRASSDAGPELAGREGHAAMESPEALIAPLERGSGGLTRTRGASGFGAAPQYKKRESSDERLKTLPKNGGFLLSHLVWQYHRR